MLNAFTLNICQFNSGNRRRYKVYRKAAFTPGNMLPGNMLPSTYMYCLLPATKLLPVCCPSVAVYKGIHVAGNKQHVACCQHVWCKRGLSYQCETGILYKIHHYLDKVNVRYNNSFAIHPSWCLPKIRTAFLNS